MLRNLETSESMAERVVFPIDGISLSKKTYFCGLDFGTPCQSQNSKQIPSYFSHCSSGNDIQEECSSSSTDVFYNSKKHTMNNINHRCTEDAGDEDTYGSLKNHQSAMRYKYNGAFKSDYHDKPWGFQCQAEPSSSSSLENNIENEITEARDIRFSECGNCSNYEERNYANIFSEESHSIAFIVGWLLIISGALLFTGTVFSVFLAPFLQPTSHNLLEFLRNDNYYCFFVPLCAPVIVLIVYANWLAMKFFLHS